MRPDLLSGTRVDASYERCSKVQRIIGLVQPDFFPIWVKLTAFIRGQEFRKIPIQLFTAFREQHTYCTPSGVHTLLVKEIQHPMDNVARVEELGGARWRACIPRSPPKFQVQRDHERSASRNSRSYIRVRHS